MSQSTFPDPLTRQFARNVSTDDADCLAQSISGWSQQYEQLDAGHFHGRLVELCFDETQIFLEHTNLRLRQRCKVPPGHIWFGLPQTTRNLTRINGMTVGPEHIALHRGGEDFELVTPEGLRFLGIVVQETALLDCAQQFERAEWLENNIQSPVLSVGMPQQKVIQQHYETILAPLHSDQITNPCLRKSLSEHTLDLLFGLLETASAEKVTRVSNRQRHRLVERADEYVRSHSDRLITVAELCSVLGISRRALQASFQDALGVSPHAYIRAVSLNAVRRHLKNPDSPYRSIQDAAAAYGFWHMSQFAQDYRQLFGERPSETLLRREKSSTTQT